MSRPIRRCWHAISAAAFVAAISLPGSSRATTVSLVASKDNSLFANNVSGSNGGGAGIFVGTTNSPQNDALRRGLLQFDVASGVPAGAVITDATLTMYLGQASMASGVQTIDLHRLTADWGEGTAGNFTTSISGTGTGSPASPGDATWNQRFYQQLDWTAPGAQGDYITGVSASTDVAPTLDTAYQWLSTAALVGDVQSWLDHPSTNDGWIMINHTEGVEQTVKAFYSRDATLKNTSGTPLPPTWRPTLDVTYTMTGEYNRNGVVDAADYVVWRSTLGSSVPLAGSGADGDQSGTIDAGDYAYWRENFGNVVSGFASGAAAPDATVPEPAAGSLLAAAGLLAFCRSRC